MRVIDEKTRQVQVSPQLVRPADIDAETLYPTISAQRILNLKSTAFAERVRNGRLNPDSRDGRNYYKGAELLRYLKENTKHGSARRGRRS